MNRLASIVACLVLCSSGFSQSPGTGGNSFSGLYRGSFSNGDQFAITVYDKNSAAIWVIGNTSKSVTYVQFFSVDQTGAFAASKGGGTISGRIAPGFTVSGTVTNSLTFTGALVPTGGQFSQLEGAYQGYAFDRVGSRASLFATITGAGEVLVYIITATAEFGALGTMNPNRSFGMRDYLGGTGSGAISNQFSDGSIQGTITFPVFGTLQFDAPRATINHRLANVSTRGFVGTGANIMIAGFVVSGGAKRVLVRASGPALVALDVPGALADPLLRVFDSSSRLVAENDNWNSLSTFLLPSAVSDAVASVGAFPFPVGSRDAAIVLNLEPGNYSAQVNGVGDTTGVALVEVYELK